jgi:glycosyltransferase involved in cell wall biosynthesis
LKNISIIIPSYNRENLLLKAIDSLVVQTYRHFEIIIVDDGSTDNTCTAIQKYHDDRIRYVYQENRGPAAARNRGIKEARYSHIAFLDSDDWFVPEKLETQLVRMKEEPHYLISHTDEIWYRRGKLLNQKKRHHKPGGYIFARCLELCTVSMSTVMVRRELFDTIGLFDESLPCCEDYDFWLRASIEHPFLKIDESLTLKDGGRPDEISVQYSVGMDKYRITSICNLLEKESLSPEQIALAKKELAYKCTVYGNGCIKHGRPEEGQYYLDMAASAG